LTPIESKFGPNRGLADGVIGDELHSVSQLLTTQPPPVATPPEANGLEAFDEPDQSVSDVTRQVL